jgi:hypothetical protein
VRCDLVEMPDLSPTGKRRVVSLAAVGVAGGAAMAAFLSLWGIPLAFVSLIVLYHGLVPGTKAVVTPSPDGRYLAFEADPDEVRREEPLSLKLVLLSGGLALAYQFVDDVADRGEWWWIALASIVIIAVTYYGTRRNEWDASELAASLRFRAMAYPARSLPDPEPAERNQLQDPARIWVDPAAAEPVEAAASASPREDAPTPGRVAGSSSGDPRAS